jgi:hypothetical protein
MGGGSNSTKVTLQHTGITYSPSTIRVGPSRVLPVLLCPFMQVQVQMLGKLSNDLKGSFVPIGQTYPAIVSLKSLHFSAIFCNSVLQYQKII